MNVKLVRVSGWFGIISPILGFAMIFLAIGTAPWFSWTENALSDLGVRGLTAVIFNSGLILTAASMMAFSLGIYELTRGSLIGRGGFAALFAASVFLAGIGFFPETMEPHHLYFSVAFFVALPVSLFLMGGFMLGRGMRAFGMLTIASAIVAALVWTPNWDGVAIPEAASALSAGIWSAVLGLHMRSTEMD